MSNPVKNVFESNPVLAALVEEHSDAQNIVAQTPPQLSTVTPQLVEFVETVNDDGAKSRLKNYDIQEAYTRWFSPKDMRDSGNGNFLTNCFNTSVHSNGDSNPSLCLKSGENVYTCYGCGISGDMVNLAGVHAGLASVDGSVTDHDIHSVVMTACQELFPDMQNGWVSRAGNWQYDPDSVIKIPNMLLADFVPLPDPQTPEQSIGQVGKFDHNLNWRDWVPYNTGLREYMEIVCEDTSPEEWHFFNYITLVGMILGREVYFAGDNPEVYGNLFICHTGVSGQGKTKTLRHLFNLLEHRRTTFNFKDATTRGIKVNRGIGSGEVLVDELGHKVKMTPITPLNGTNPAPPAPAMWTYNESPRSLFTWAEFSNLIAKTRNNGSTMADKVIEMYDVPKKMSAVTRGTKTTGGGEAYHPYGSALSTVQLDRLQTLLTKSDQDSGFLNRWIFVIGTSKPYEPYSKSISIDPVYRKIDQQYAWLDELVRSKKNAIFFAPDALEESKRFLTEVIRPFQLDEETASMFTRMDLFFKKLMLILSANMLEKEISIEAVYQAERVWRYIEHSMLIVIDKLHKDGTVEIVDHIINIVEESSYRVTKDGTVKLFRASELNQRVRRKYDLDNRQADYYIDQAINEGSIIKAPDPYGKPGNKNLRFLPAPK